MLHRNDCLSACLVLLLFATATLDSGPALAARADLNYSIVRSSGGAVVAATLEGVEEVVEMRPGGGDEAVVTAYRFKLRIVEVLYGDGLAAGNVVPIDKSYRGYGSVWEGLEETGGYGGIAGNSNVPPDGTKVIAFLEPPQDGQRDLYDYIGSVLVVSDFGDPRVEMWRQIGRLWSMPPSRELFALLVEGSQRENQPYQLYCLRALRANLENERLPNFTGIELEGVASQDAIKAQLWKCFTDESTPLEAVRFCDDSLSALVPNAEGTWRMHPVRYKALTSAIRRQVADGEPIDWQQITHAVGLLCQNPARASETRNLILELAATPPVASRDKQFSHPKQVLSELCTLYVPGTTSVAAGKLNKQILKDLTTRFEDPKQRGSAIYLWHIAEICAAVGISRDDLIEPIMQTEQRLRASGDNEYFHTDVYVPQINSSLARARSAIGETKLPEVLSWPYDDLLEKRVCLVRRGANSPLTVSIDGDQPRVKFFPAYAIVIGTLTKHPVQHFDLVPGKEFGSGIPIPPGYSAESIAVRYSLENPSWIVVPSGK